MANKIELYFLHLYIFVYLGMELSIGEECPSASGGCCSGYYRDATTKKCQECPIGLFGNNCSQHCTSGFYGSRCLKRCKGCIESRCNHITGCEESASVGKTPQKIQLPVSPKGNQDTTTQNLGLTKTGILDNDIKQDGGSNTTTHLVLFIIITITVVVLIVFLFVFRQKKFRTYACNILPVMSLKSHFRHEDDLPETEEVAIRNVPDDYTYDGVDGLYYEIRESQMVNLRNLVGGKSDCHNDRRISRSMNNLQKTSVYNHLNYTKSTPNISGYFNNIYDHFNDTDDDVYDVSRRQSAGNCLYGIIEM